MEAAVRGVRTPLVLVVLGAGGAQAGSKGELLSMVLDFSTWFYEDPVECTLVILATWLIVW